MNLSHYSTAPIEFVRSRTDQGVAAKPNGLWLSVDGPDDWLEWCKSEMPHWIIGKLHYRVHADLDRVLTIKTSTDLHVFTQEQGRNGYGCISEVDWGAVASAYAGIIIAPYQWSCRLEDQTFWYYSWDCASGCIWDASAIERLEVMAEKRIGQELVAVKEAGQE